MYSYRNHIRGIVDEFVSNSMKAKASKIDVSIEVLDDFVTISAKDNGIGIPPEKLEELEEQLMQPRRHELEEYYGSLAGDSSMGRGLTLVGMITDDASIKSTPGVGTEIKVALKLNSSR
ncbi:MAG: ATP-binding protein [Erysipelotrichia bacterium]|nr:ATP-binding protein [Erysipelotrichia bacterium]